MQHSFSIIKKRTFFCTKAVSQLFKILSSVERALSIWLPKSFSRSCASEQNGEAPAESSILLPPRQPDCWLMALIVLFLALSTSNLYSFCSAASPPFRYYGIFFLQKQGNLWTMLCCGYKKMFRQTDLSQHHISPILMQRTSSICKKDCREIPDSLFLCPTTITGACKFP